MSDVTDTVPVPDPADPADPAREIVTVETLTDRLSRPTGGGHYDFGERFQTERWDAEFWAAAGVVKIVTDDKPAPVPAPKKDTD